MSYQDNNCNIEFKIVLALYLVIILYIFSNNDVDMSVKLCFLLIFYAMLYIDYKIDNRTDNYENQHMQNNETFKNTYNNTYNDQPMTHRQMKIKELNNNRCSEGRFFVNCPSCGRNRILDDKMDKIDNKINNVIRKCKFCTRPCIKDIEKKMSFFNQHYIDSDKIFSYAGNLIDADEKNASFVQSFGRHPYELPYNRSYVYWPSLDDPVNGPPYVVPH
jgi:hypothetical protein